MKEQIKELSLHERLFLIKRLMKLRSARFELLIGEDDSVLIEKIESEQQSEGEGVDFDLPGEDGALIRLNGSWYRAPELNGLEDSMRRYVG